MSELDLQHPSTDAQVTRSIESLMRDKYCAPEWALLFNVGNGTGHHCTGWADAIAMSLYPSRGLAIHGFEFKASRTDWTKELKDPHKAEKVAKYCDFWWLVARADIVKDAELPLGWGQMEWRDSKLKLVRAASQMKPVQLDREFIAAILRRSAESDQKVIDELVRKQVDKDRAEHQQSRKDAIERDRSEYSKVLKNLKELKEKTGIDLRGYQATDEVARAIKLVLDSDLVSDYSGIQRIIETVEAFAKRIRETASAAGVVLDKEIVP